MRSYTLKGPRCPYLGKITNHFGFFSHVGRPSVRVLPQDYIWTIEFAKIPVGCHCSEFMIGALQSGKHKAGSVTCTWNWNLFVQLRLISVQSIISSQDRKTLISHTIFSSHLVLQFYLNEWGIVSSLQELLNRNFLLLDGWKMFCHTLLQAAFIVYNHIIKKYNDIFGGNFFDLQWIYGNLFATGSQVSIEIAGESVHQTFFLHWSTWCRPSPQYERRRSTLQQLPCCTGDPECCCRPTSQYQMQKKDFAPWRISVFMYITMLPDDLNQLFVSRSTTDSSSSIMVALCG